MYLWKQPMKYTQHYNEIKHGDLLKLQQQCDVVKNMIINVCNKITEKLYMMSNIKLINKDHR